ncbi:hypothetical protein BGX20_007599, partial [Mortierella sp. AD010]
QQREQLRQERRQREQQERHQREQLRQEKLRRERIEYPERPLLLKYQRKVIQDEMEPGLARQKIGPVFISLAEAAAVLAIRASPIDNTKPRVISSDGSLINTNTDNVAMAFGVVDLSQSVARVVHGRTDGHASSAKAELMGLLAAILSAPPDQDVRVELDNQAVVQQFQQLVHYRFTGEWKTIFKTTAMQDTW